MISQVFSELKKYQSTVAYPFGDNPEVRSYLEKVNIFDEEKLYTISKSIEETQEGSLRFITTLKSSPRSPRRVSRDVANFLQADGK